VVLNYSPLGENRKAVTPVSNHSIGGGCGFGDLILDAFRFDEGVVLELPTSFLFWAHTDLTLVERGLDRWLPHNNRVLSRL
jgi:hypothetical protein